MQNLVRSSRFSFRKDSGAGFGGFKPKAGLSGIYSKNELRLDLVGSNQMRRIWSLFKESHGAALGMFNPKAITSGLIQRLLGAAFGAPKPAAVTWGIHSINELGLVLEGSGQKRSLGDFPRWLWAALGLPSLISHSSCTFGCMCLTLGCILLACQCAKG